MTLPHNAPPHLSPNPSVDEPPHGSPVRPLDLAGVGLGPAGLSLAALSQELPALRTAWYDQRESFRWHPGLLIDGATLQVPFLADLVTLASPTSRWSFLNYLKEQQRLYPFYFAERFHIPRTEYDAYCRWVSRGLPGLYFGHQADALRWSPREEAFHLDHSQTTADGGHTRAGRTTARNVVLATGSIPYLPPELRPLTAGPEPLAVHSADYAHSRERLLAAGHITVIGSGQSGAEVFLDLLRQRPAGQERLHWITRSPAFAPMEYSKLGLEHFTPDYTDYFHSLDPATRESLLDRQWQLHKAIDQDTIAAIHEELRTRTQNGGWPDTVLTPGTGVRSGTALGRDGFQLTLEHREQGSGLRLITDAVVLATGYRDQPLDPLLEPLGRVVRRDGAGRPLIDRGFRLRLDASVRGAVFIAGAERHSHGVGTPDLGLLAQRSATILNTVSGCRHFSLPERTAFTTFGLPGGYRGNATVRSDEHSAAHS